MAERFSRTLQENLLTILSYVDDSGRLVANLIQPNLFEGDYRIVAERVLAHWKQYDEAPKQHTADLFSDIIEDPNNRHAKTYTRILSSIVALSDGVNTAYVLDQLKNFTRLQKLKSAIIQSAEKLNALQESGIGEVEAVWNGLLRVREVDFEAGLRLTDVDKVLDYLNNQASEFQIGIKELDRHHINPYRGAVMLWLGATGGGKSWMFVHMGKQALMQRKKVLHISLEMSAEQVAARYYQSLFAVGKRDRKNKVSRLEIDKVGKLRGINKEEVIADFSLTDELARDELVHHLGWMEGRLHNLIIKRFPRLTMDQLQAYLDNLEMVEKFIPDVVMIDYFGITEPEPSKDFRLGLGRAFVKFRSILVERHLVGITAQQSSKEGAQANQVKLQHVAEDWSLTNTSDMVMTISATDTEKRFGLARLYVGKARDESDRFGVLITQNFATGQFVLDSTYLGPEYWDLISDQNKPISEGEDDASEEGD